MYFVRVETFPICTAEGSCCGVRCDRFSALVFSTTKRGRVEQYATCTYLFGKLRTRYFPTTAIINTLLGHGKLDVLWNERALKTTTPTRPVLAARAQTKLFRSRTKPHRRAFFFQEQQSHTVQAPCFRLLYPAVGPFLVCLIPCPHPRGQIYM